ncbi:ribosomal L1 domain-containing protein 1 [Elysia marginata]|uniref:Ribosomal L1 domain-containing protein 1 n=1 Tax=Elysia marginata TaxID=1093978 RepID=A0AAV4JDD7_9GAST|nr:ribosomal L1 domain-containing protein 1 [Elysia marginata]
MTTDMIVLDQTKVEKAAAALRQLMSTAKVKKELIENADDVELQISLKKIPQKEQTIKLKLPNSIKKTDAEVCLFVKDLDRTEREYEATVRHFQDLLKKKGVKNMPEIIPLKSLKTEYKPYEAKRNLSNAYDIFLCDIRVTHLLPSLLGKHFYGKKKAPIQVNLQAKDLAAEMEAAVSNSRCSVSTKGSSSRWGRHSAWLTVTKELFSLALSYHYTGGPQEVTVPKRKAPVDVEAEEISTLFGAKVKVFPNGKIQVINDGEENSDSKPSFSAKKKLGKRKSTPTKQKGSGNKKAVKRKPTKKPKRV